MNYKNHIINKPKQTSYAQSLTKEERLRVFANMIIDRVIEEEGLYRERLKTDPNAKRIFETCECPKCFEKRRKSSGK